MVGASEGQPETGFVRGFVIRYWVMEVLRSAFRHGIDSEDIHHALRHSLVVEEIGEDPTRYLVLGPNQAGVLLELVVLDRPKARL